MRVNCLRISVTDRCNQRCVYCRPQADCDFIERTEILRYEEIQRLVRLFAECGIDRVRLTGGEPLVRRDVVSLIAGLAATPGMRDVALTTNGVLLEAMAADLKAAGLNRVNVSLDALHDEAYDRITGLPAEVKSLSPVRTTHASPLRHVLRGIHRALAVGLQPVKINAVILRHINASEILALAALSLELPVIVRFIEYCPTNRRTEPADDYVPYAEIRRIIEQKFGPLVDTVLVPGNGPASYFRIARGVTHDPGHQSRGTGHGARGTEHGIIGFIAGRSTVFCSACSRLRLTSDGLIKPCLYSPRGHDLKTLLRGGASDERIREVLRQILVQKAGISRLDALDQEFCMRKVGG